MIEKDVKHFYDSIFHEILKTAIYARVKGTQYFNKLDLGITFEQYIALDAIYAKGEICQRDLSKLILKDRSNTGRLLTALEKGEFIERKVETKNNRLIKKLYITEKGKNLLEIQGEKIRENTRYIFDGMKQEDFDTLRRLLKQIRECISEDTCMQI